MSTYRAITRNVMMSPRKARLVADLIRGKGVVRAFEILAFTEKRAASALRKTLKSAVANAGAAADHDLMVVSKAIVNEGPRLKRMFPRPRGMATPIARPMCHIHLEVSEVAQAAAPAPEAPAVKPAKKSKGGRHGS